MDQKFTENLRDWVMTATEEIFKEAYCRNTKDPREVYPLPISENDLTCELYKRLSTHSEIRITTEVTIPRSEGGNRYDIGIFPEDPAFQDPPCGCYYNKDSKGNPDEWDCRRYLAFIEIKNNWFESKKKVWDDLSKDLEALLNAKVKDRAYLLMGIFFDYVGILNLDKFKEILSEKEYSDISYIYGDVKNGKLFLKISSEFQILSYSC